MEHGAPVVNGISAAALGELEWVKSARSGPQGNCVELAPVGGRQVAVRNSRDPQGPALIFGQDDIRAVVAAARAGDLDHLLG